MQTMTSGPPPALLQHLLEVLVPPPTIRWPVRGEEEDEEAREAIDEEEVVAIRRGAEVVGGTRSPGVG